MYNVLLTLETKVRTHAINITVWNKKPSHDQHKGGNSCELFATTLQDLYKVGLQDFGTLEKWRVSWVVEATVIKDFGHVSHKVAQPGVCLRDHPVLHNGQICSSKHISG